ncbi:hypothetical protein [Caenispirillum bisanense]|uniref:Spermidine synthase n=1 Tax=Caenispirillum bisanense TaxID=414052 RepID=A0A286GYJ8_9PROT|nr:hypothetical protein [Caenispirillum bisanense]SOE00266.1 hypothetical protein SAMN05421508_1126 [Caenispirillum bisanense]
MTAAALRRFGFEPLAEPPWREAEAGPWRLRVQRGSAAHGYVSRTVVEPRRAVLCKGRTPWMSNGALERESHAWHGERARGLVVVAGLGMGLHAHAVAAKPEVERVVVAEVAPDVIAVMCAGSGFDAWPHRDKVTLLQADVLAPDFAARLAAATGGRRPDYLYADIWPDYPAAAAPAQTAALVRALDPVAAGWWGQELAAAAWAHRRRLPLAPATLDAWAAATGLPPLAAEERHAAFVRAAAALVDVAALAGEARPGWLDRLRQRVEYPALRLAIGRRDR